MGSHVCRQTARLRECHAAGRTGVGAVAGMGVQVLRQVASLREGLPIGGSGAGAVAGMSADATSLVAWLRAGLARRSGTRQSRSWPLSRPDPSCLTQQ